MCTSQLLAFMLITLLVIITIMQKPGCGKTKDTYADPKFTVITGKGLLEKEDTDRFDTPSKCTVMLGGNKRSDMTICEGFDQDTNIYNNMNINLQTSEEIDMDLSTQLAPKTKSSLQVSNEDVLRKHRIARDLSRTGFDKAQLVAYENGYGNANKIIVR